LQNDLAEHTKKIETNGCLNLDFPAPKGMEPDIKAKLKSKAKPGKDKKNSGSRFTTFSFSAILVPLSVLVSSCTALHLPTID
jgi:hypothetical protein